MKWFVDQQSLEAPFGSDDNGMPNKRDCKSCSLVTGQQKRRGCFETSLQGQKRAKLFQSTSMPACIAVIIIGISFLTIASTESTVGLRIVIIVYIMMFVTESSYLKNPCPQGISCLTLNALIRRRGPPVALERTTGRREGSAYGSV